MTATDDVPRVAPEKIDTLVVELMDATSDHVVETHDDGGVRAKLNWLRAAVLGANDGLTSTAGLVVGMLATNAAHGAVITAGAAGLAAGAVSMALGEYVSVSTQRDTERALIFKERREISGMERDEILELADIFQRKGVTRQTALRMALELHTVDPVEAHMQAEHGIDPGDLTNPWAAAGSSAIAFILGALIPLIAIIIPGIAPIATVLAFTAVGFVIAGYVSAYLGHAPRAHAVIRILGGGAIAMAVTYGIGLLLGTAVA